MQPKYVIKAKKQHLFWSNEHGWTSIEEATIFSQAETISFNLLKGSVWLPLWEVDQIQFARFIAECETCGLFDDAEKLAAVGEEMGLELDEVCSIIDRAKTVLDKVKSNI